MNSFDNEESYGFNQEHDVVHDASTSTTNSEMDIWDITRELGIVVTDCQQVQSQTEVERVVVEDLDNLPIEAEFNLNNKDISVKKHFKQATLSTFFQRSSDVGKMNENHKTNCPSSNGKVDDVRYMDNGNEVVELLFSQPNEQSIPADKISQDFTPVSNREIPVSIPRENGAILNNIEPSEISESTESPTSNNSRKRPHKVYKQKFVDSWLNHDEFQGWLEKRRRHSSSKEFTAYCCACAEYLTNGKSEIQRHGKSVKHQRFARLLNEIEVQRKQISEFFGNNTRKDMVNAELKLCCFLAEKNLPISLIESLIRLMKSLFPKNELLKSLHLGKQKASNMIRDGIGLQLKTELVLDLSKTFFSIVIDETTDVGVQSQLAAMVQYWDYKSGKMIVELLDMLVCVDGTAEGLSTAVLTLLDDLKIPKERLIGISADTCNVMFGRNNSVTTILKKAIPDLLTVKCSCHTIHLCSSYASKKLPEELEDTIKNVYNHFSRSSSRRRSFAAYQEFAKCEKHIILSPGQTRWLSLEYCVNRLLEQLVPLRNYFQEEVNDDGTKATKGIKDYISLELTPPFLEFLKYALGCLNEFNTLFQSESPMLYQLKSCVNKLVRDFASNFMNLNYVKGLGSSCLEKIDPWLTSQYVPLNKIYLGMECKESVDALKSDEDKKFLVKHCRSFYIEAILQMKKRFDFSDAFFEIVNIVLPTNARKRNPENLNQLFKRFPALKKEVDCAKAETEWRAQALIDPQEIGRETEDEVRLMNPEEYWVAIFKLCYGFNRNAKPRFPNLMICVSFLLSMPFSNVIAEREFSLLKLIKTDTRNRLKNITLTSLLRIKAWLKKSGVSACNIVMTEEMFKAILAVRANKPITGDKECLENGDLTNEDENEDDEKDDGISNI